MSAWEDRCSLAAVRPYLHPLLLPLIEAQLPKRMAWCISCHSSRARSGTGVLIYEVGVREALKAIAAMFAPCLLTQIQYCKMWWSKCKAVFIFEYSLCADNRIVI